MLAQLVLALTQRCREPIDATLPAKDHRQPVLAVLGLEVVLPGEAGVLSAHSAQQAMHFSQP
jgi:hypothetical protein